MTRRIFSDDERRARLVARHHLGRTAATPEEAVRAVVAQHSSDPLTPFLAAWARIPGFLAGHLEAAMYERRSLWRLHAMRRTLFVVPTGDAPYFDAAASRGVALQERKRLVQWLAAEMPASEVAPWCAAVEAQVMEALREGGELRTQDLGRLVPELARPVTVGSGKWTQRVPVSSRVLFLMALDGRIARTRPQGSWRSSQYRWVTAEAFAGSAGPFGHEGASIPEAEGRAFVLRRYLETHGPATLTDIRWWSGWTVKQTMPALAAVRAVAVGLEGGAEGFVLPGDEAVDEPAASGVALLSGLDSTPMGWKERPWYLGPHAGLLFDRNGNVGPTIWVDGRIVGGWGHRASGEVAFRLLDDVGGEAGAAVEREAAALTAWLAGQATAVKARFPTPLEKELMSS